MQKLLKILLLRSKSICPIRTNFGEHLIWQWTKIIFWRAFNLVNIQFGDGWMKKIKISKHLIWRFQTKITTKISKFRARQNLYE